MTCYRIYDELNQDLFILLHLLKKYAMTFVIVNFMSYIDLSYFLYLPTLVVRN